MKPNPEQSEVQEKAGSPCKKVKPLIAVSILVLILGAAALLNPSQDRHFEEIEKTIQRRHLSPGDGQYTVQLLASYNNYFLFSTVTFGSNKVIDDSRLLSYGFLGTIKTTGNIRTVMIAIYEWEERQKKKE